MSLPSKHKVVNFAHVNSAPWYLEKRKRKKNISFI